MLTTINITCRAKLLLLLVALFLLGGCASTKVIDNSDPWEPGNRKINTFNDKLDVHLMQPIAKGYATVTPQPVRAGITNVFSNMGYINVIFNDLLQGQFVYGLKDTARFVMNSTLGFGGLFDPATDAGLPARDEDTGQSLAKYGVDQGPYVILPFLGPNTARNTTNLVTTTLLNPFFYLTSPLIIPLGALTVINARANLLDETRLRDEAALDSYTFTREAYLQKRRYDIYDGDPPAEDLDEFFDDEFEDDEFDQESDALLID